MSSNSLPAPCPHCNHEHGTLIIRSSSVLTLKCPQCGHSWSLDLHDLSPQLKAQLTDALRESA